MRASRTRLRPARPRRDTGVAGRTRHARPAQRRTSGPKYSAQNGPSVAVRGIADGVHRPSWRPDAVRYTSVDTATHRLTVAHIDTRRDKKETARLAENSQLAGRFRRWWQVLGSNQRGLSRRFYRPLSSCTSHMPLTCINVPRGQIPVRCRPSGVRATLARAAHGQGRARSRTPGQGAVTLTVRAFRVPRCPGVHPAERGRVLLRAARVTLARCHQAGRQRGGVVGRRISSRLPSSYGRTRLTCRLSARPWGITVGTARGGWQ
jgi:hypothetical protein